MLGRFFLFFAMATGRGKKEETNLQNQAQTAYNEYKPSALETKQNDRVTNFLSDMDSGKDVKDIDYLRPYYNLYNNAASDDFSGLSGVGLLGNNALSGSNGQIAGVIGKQLASRRQQEASGDLYNAVNDAQTAATNEGNYLINTEQNRMAGKAGLANERYTAYLNRPRKPSIWEQLLQGGMQAGAAYLSHS